MYRLMRTHRRLRGLTHRMGEELREHAEASARIR